MPNDKNDKLNYNFQHKLIYSNNNNVVNSSIHCTIKNHFGIMDIAGFPRALIFFWPLYFFLVEGGGKRADWG